MIGTLFEPQIITATLAIAGAVTGFRCYQLGQLGTPIARSGDFVPMDFGVSEIQEDTERDVYATRATAAAYYTLLFGIATAISAVDLFTKGSLQGFLYVVYALLALGLASVFIWQRRRVSFQLAWALYLQFSVRHKFSAPTEVDRLFAQAYPAQSRRLRSYLAKAQTSYEPLLIDPEAK